MSRAETAAWAMVAVVAMIVDAKRIETGALVGGWGSLGGHRLVEQCWMDKQSGYIT